MKKKTGKIILIVVIIAAAAAGGISGGLYYRNENLTAEVVSVADMNYGYWGDEVYSYGQVTNDYSQTVYVSREDTIAEVYVEEGQQVQEGDKLLAYDTTVSELNYNMKVLEVENLKNKIAIAENDLKKLKKTKPYVPPAEPAQEEPAAEPVQEPTDPEMTGSAYNYISETAVPYNQGNADGSKDNPYRYLCTAGAYVTGEFLRGLAEQGTSAVFEVYADNQISGEPVISWQVDGNTLAVPDEGTKWSVADRTQVIDEIEEPQPEPEEEEIQEPEIGYTQEELNEMISDKEQELKELDLSKRKAELEVEKEKQKSTDGVVYAKVTGTIKNLQDVDNLPDDGTPFMEVSGSEGLYVTGALSELLLEDIKPGQIVMVSSWESGISCEAQITEIETYPLENANAYGEGNQNVSYYPYTAYIEDTSGLRNGEYVDMSMTIGGNEDGDAIYLSKAYVRTENGRSYVLKADENNRLKKQYVVTGKTIYGDTVEIKSGISEEDRIAFPYGKNAKEGIRAVDSDSGM